MREDSGGGGARDIRERRDGSVNTRNEIPVICTFQSTVNRHHIY